MFLKRNEKTQKRIELLRRKISDLGRNFFKGQIEVAPSCFIFFQKRSAGRGRCIFNYIDIYKMQMRSLLVW